MKSHLSAADSTKIGELLGLGEKFWIQNQSDSALLVFQELLDLSEKINYPEGIFEATVGIGRIYYYKTTKRPVGVEYYQKSLVIAKKINDPLLLSRAYYQLAIANDHIENFEVSKDLFFKSFQLARVAHHQVRLSASLNALVYFHAYSLHRSVDSTLVRPVLDSLINVSNDPIVLARCWDALSIIYRQQKDYDQAIYASKIALENFRKSKDSEYETIDKLNDLNQLYFALHQMGKVKETSMQILEAKHVPHLGIATIVGQTYVMLSDAYAQEMNYKKALELEERGREMLDSLKKYEVNSKLLNIQSEFDLKSKQKEIEILNKNSVIQQAQIERQSQQFIFLTVFTVALLIFSVLLFMIKEARKKANLQINTAFDELKMAQDQLVQSEKMAFLGRLTSGVAHEINTPLGAIKASAENVQHAFENVLSKINEISGLAPSECFPLISELIQFSSAQKLSGSFAELRAFRKNCGFELQRMGIPKSEPLAEYLTGLGIVTDLKKWETLLRLPRALELIQLVDEVLAIKRQNLNIGMAVSKASKILFALKKYSHQVPDDKPSDVDIIENIETVLSIYSSNLKQTKLIKNFGSVDEVIGYPDELTQVWTNLIHNSIQAMDGKGEMIITTENHSPDEIKVEIVDRGYGISKENQKKIFEPFFTTKASGEGTGLGLSIVKKIIDKHNGRIECESEVMKGTTFRVFLPRRHKSEKNDLKTLQASAL